MQYDDRKKIYELSIKGENIQIGDATDTTKFKPSMQFNRWGKERFLKLSYDGAPGLDNLSQDKLKYVTLSLDLSWYYKEPEIKHHEGCAFRLGDSVEFDITLKSKPASNKISFAVDQDGLIFHFQKYNKDITGELKPFVIRPPWVEGSYAVYHDSKKNNKYKTGKAFHIYRPLAKDADGKEQWCDFSADLRQTGMLTIVVPQTFLDTAKYPITIDPEVGYHTNGSSSTSLEGYSIATEDTTGVGESGTIISGHWYGYANAATLANWYVAVWASGDPAALIDASDGENAPEDVAPDWRQATWGTPVGTLLAETAYSIGGCTPGGVGTPYSYYDDDNDGATGHYTSAGPPPPNPVDWTSHDWKHCFYVEFGGGAVNVTVEPGVITASINAQASIPRADVQVSLDALTAQIEVQTPAVSIEVTAALDLLGVSISALSMTIRTDVQASAAVLSNTINMFSPTVMTELTTALNLLSARMTALSPTIDVDEVAGESLLRLIRDSRIEKTLQRRTETEKTLLRKC